MGSSSCPPRSNLYTLTFPALRQGGNAVIVYRMLCMRWHPLKGLWVRSAWQRTKRRHLKVRTMSALPSRVVEKVTPGILYPAY